jgi:hypothetical protein
MDGISKEVWRSVWGDIDIDALPPRLLFDYQSVKRRKNGQFDMRYRHAHQVWDALDAYIQARWEARQDARLARMQ